MTTPLTAAEVRSIIAEEMNRLAERADIRGLYIDANDLRSTFPFPSPPVLPSPADDWRKACVVVRTSCGCCWDALSPCRMYCLTEKGVWAKNTMPDTGDHTSESSARSALAKAPPYPGYTPPLPAKVEGETVDAAFVAANAGEYRNIDGEIFRSDGAGSVIVTLGDGKTKEWVGVEVHERSPATRFRPLPLRPKDNKCESSEPVAGGERPDRTPKPLPVTTRTQLIGQQGQQADAWCAVAQALDTYFPKWNPWCGRSATENAVLCIEQAAADLARLQSELAGVRHAVNHALVNAEKAGLAEVRAALNPVRDSSRPLAPAEVSRG